jgi:hypothetical protein
LQEYDKIRSRPKLPPNLLDKRSTLLEIKKNDLFVAHRKNSLPLLFVYASVSFPEKKRPLKKKEKNREDALMEKTIAACSKCLDA